ncbi:MAG: UDP-N-acetylmuramate dehydrogenase [Deltaproteobacteria bacterium]|nr:UDP-N-acetylmuramate dehydrogenase [Deltaproteobacteria bacterium]
MNWTDKREKLAAMYEGLLEEMVLLKNFTSFKIGGPARLFATVNRAEAAAQLIVAANQLKIPYLVVGGGTNLLVSDDGFDGLAILLNMTDVTFDLETHAVTAGASLAVSDLVTRVISKHLAGMEFAAGLPGTVGGAVAGNAGCFGSSFGEILSSAHVLMSSGELRQVDASFFQFTYRKTTVAEQKALVLGATFGLAEGNPVQLEEIASSNLELRRTRHPARDVCTAGSYFKNLPPLRKGEHRRAAGALLEQVGAREMSVGDAAVFEKHANILVNRGNATARDMLMLQAKLQARVWERFGVMLEPEVRFVGRRPTLD